jgi:hypothetical protein
MIIRPADIADPVAEFIDKKANRLSDGKLKYSRHSTANSRHGGYAFIQMKDTHRTRAPASYKLTRREVA